LLPGMESNHRR